MAFFPSKLHKILTVKDETGQDAIISWLPHGKAFKVHKPEEFEATIMRKHFKQSSFTSFVRQLNLWGFKKITRIGDDQGSYCHPFFERGRPEMCHRMVRQVQSKKGSKLSKHSKHELWTTRSTTSDESGDSSPELQAPTITRLPYSSPTESVQSFDTNGTSDSVQQPYDSSSQNFLRQSALRTVPCPSEVNLADSLAQLNQQHGNIAHTALLLANGNSSLGSNFRPPAAAGAVAGDTPFPGSGNKTYVDMIELLALLELHNRLKHMARTDVR